MMMRSVTILLCLAAVSGFRVNNRHIAKPSWRSASSLQMSDSSEPAKESSKPSKPTPSTSIVPLEKVNIENASAVTGGILGLVLGGPVLGLIFAAITNYVVKKDDDSGEALRGVGKTVIESYNFLNKINSKYDVTGKVGGSITKAVDSIETESDSLKKIKTTVKETTGKIEEINKEYDLVTKGKEILVAAATLSDTAFDKVTELNKKYDFVKVAKDTTAKVVDKVKEQAKQG